MEERGGEERGTNEGRMERGAGVAKAAKSTVRADWLPTFILSEANAGSSRTEHTQSISRSALMQKLPHH